MRPRALIELTQLPSGERIAAIAEGMDLIHRHVSALIAGVDDLNPSQNAVVAQLAEEESAKALILIDIVRTGPRDQKAINRLTRAFYSHLARGIYSDLVTTRPTCFGDTRKWVDSMRESHYLDGPMDVNWIFRNEVLQRRESSIYVDFVAYEGGRSWDDPDRRNEILSGECMPAVAQIFELHKAGCFSEPGLTEIADAWSGIELTDETPWTEAFERNKLVFERLTPADDEYGYKALANWQFPLGSLDLRMKIVAISSLEEKRANWCFGDV